MNGRRLLQMQYTIDHLRAAFNCMQMPSITRVDFQELLDQSTELLAYVKKLREEKRIIGLHDD